MEEAVVVGNCQAKALEMMLNTNDAFAKRFEFASFPAVHEIPDAMVPELHEAVARAAVVVLQRVDDRYRDGLGLGTETLAKVARTNTIVRWPSVFWAGYFPDLFYLRDGEGQPVVDGPFDYHDRRILRAYADGLDADRTCRLLEDPDRSSQAPEYAANATAELDIREQACDVHVASFIASKFREKLLFFTLNHPANLLLEFMAQQIVDLIGIPGEVDHERIPDEILGSTLYPFHANHIRALGLEFGQEVGAGHTPFRIRGVAYESEVAVRMFFEYYAAYPELVALNLSGQG